MRKTIGVLVLILGMALTACGGDAGQQSAGNVDPVVGAGNGDSAELSEEVLEAMTKEHITTFFTAVQNLDAETMQPYLSELEYEQVCKIFNIVKSDPRELEFWNKTVGEIMYFPDSGALVAKSNRYIFSKWYTDCWSSNTEIPDELSLEDLDAIYDKYYEEAPYAINRFFTLTFFYLSEDGAIAEVDLGQFWTAMGCTHLDTPPYDCDAVDIRLAVLMDSSDTISSNYEKIAEDIPGYADLLSKDIDRLIEIVDAWPKAEKAGLYFDCYNQYYKNEENKEIMQQFLNEECDIYRIPYTIYVFTPYDPEKMDPKGRYVTLEDRQTLKEMDLRLVEMNTIRSFPENFDNNFTAYYDIVSCAKDLGVVE